MKFPEFGTIIIQGTFKIMEFRSYAQVFFFAWGILYLFH